jgi:hypothetical protein
VEEELQSWIRVHHGGSGGGGGGASASWRQMQDQDLHTGGQPLAEMELLSSSLSGSPHYLFAGGGGGGGRNSPASPLTNTRKLVQVEQVVVEQEELIQEVSR